MNPQKVYPSFDGGEASDTMEDPYHQIKSPVPSDGICLGITTDVVMVEIATLLKIKLANILHVSLDNVQCSITWNDGKVIPEINIDGDAAEGLTPDDIRQVIRQVWWSVKPELEDRLQGLGTRRGREA